MKNKNIKHPDTSGINSFRLPLPLKIEKTIGLITMLVMLLTINLKAQTSSRKAWKCTSNREIYNYQINF